MHPGREHRPAHDAARDDHARRRPSSRPPCPCGPDPRTRTSPAAGGRAALRIGQSRVVEVEDRVGRDQVHVRRRSRRRASRCRASSRARAPRRPGTSWLAKSNTCAAPRSTSIGMMSRADVVGRVVVLRVVGDRLDQRPRRRRRSCPSRRTPRRARPAARPGARGFSRKRAIVPPVGGDLHHAELARLLDRHAEPGDGDAGAALEVLLDHLRAGRSGRRGRRRRRRSRPAARRRSGSGSGRSRRPSPRTSAGRGASAPAPARRSCRTASRAARSLATCRSRLWLLYCVRTAIRRKPPLTRFESAKSISR